MTRRTISQTALALAILATPAIAWAAAILGHHWAALVLMTPPALFGALVAADIWTEPPPADHAARNRHPSAR